MVGSFAAFVCYCGSYRNFTTRTGFSQWRCAACLTLAAVPRKALFGHEFSHLFWSRTMFSFTLTRYGEPQLPERDETHPQPVEYVPYHKLHGGSSGLGQLTYL